ncbi:MAG TPA: arginase family protein [Candidatus Nesterenkonia stercoripullorum]|uniref:Arginase family protein n=1 Tax=Candidatus Nesterenkonia stercoripullorum TaxID=2838701 RepID=A0A9D1UU37_9MICC|nr:arginase family protein [Candidatus Nesterenkonia stercoripullorum]
MTRGWGLQLVVPLWQGSNEPGIASGAERLAEMVEQSGLRRRVDPDLGSNEECPVGEDSSLIKGRPAVEEHLNEANGILRSLAPRSVLTLGGDCAVEVAPISHLAAIHPELRVVWIDAHADLNTPESSPSGLAHGMPLRTVLGEGDAELVPATTVLPDRVALVGTRSIDKPEQEFIEAHGLRVLSPRHLRQDPGSLAEFVDSWLPEGAPLYVHLDLDVLDPEVWPAVALPEPDGLDVPALVAAIDSLQDRGDVVGVGITEYVPEVRHDPSTLRPVLHSLGIGLHDR